MTVYINGVAQIGITDVGEGHILLLGHNYNSIGQGTWAYTIDPQEFLNGHFDNIAGVADGDNLSWKVYLQKGTYTLRYFTRTTAAGGIVDFWIDADEVASFDCYSAGTILDVPFSQTGIVIANSGIKTIKIQVDGKHASSSNYRCYIATLALWRTA